jgi:hypothetical protein
LNVKRYHISLPASDVLLPNNHDLVFAGAKWSFYLYQWRAIRYRMCMTRLHFLWAGGRALAASKSNGCGAINRMRSIPISELRAAAPGNPSKTSSFELFAQVRCVFTPATDGGALKPAVALTSRPCQSSARARARCLT